MFVQSFNPPIAVRLFKYLLKSLRYTYIKEGKKTRGREGGGRSRISG